MTTKSSLSFVVAVVAVVLGCLVLFTTQAQDSMVQAIDMQHGWNGGNKFESLQTLIIPFKTFALGSTPGRTDDNIPPEQQDAMEPKVGYDENSKTNVVAMDTDTQPATLPTTLSHDANDLTEQPPVVTPSSIKY